VSGKGAKAKATKQLWAIKASQARGGKHERRVLTVWWPGR
jgi:hypothetical protein